MKSIIIKQIARSLAGLGIAMLGSSAFAAANWTQDLVADCGTAASQTCAGLPQIVVSGWSTGTAGTNFVAAMVNDYGAPNGLGVVGGGDSNSLNGSHATDNVNGIDAMMIKFTAGPLNLSSLTIGWNSTDVPTNNTSGIYNDSDLTLLAWTGGSAGPTMANASLATLLATGWTLVGNYANVGASNGVSSNSASAAWGGTQTAPDTIYSSYWLISAFSSAFGSGANLDQGNDSFKVLSIAGNTCSGTVTGNTCGGSSTNVPEPSSLALLGVAMMGFVVSRRRKSKLA